MATENLFIEQCDVKTASFDLVNRVLTVPYLDGNISAELYDLLLGHEVGHALETPAEGWHDSIVDHGVDKSILNVCEDARIEKKIKRKFPGIRVSFLKGYSELLERNFFRIQGKDVNTLNFIDRVNLHTKCGVHLDIKFKDDELVLLSEVENTETFEEVVEVAKKIQKFMKHELEKMKSTATGRKKLVITIDPNADSNKSLEKMEELDPSEYDEIEIEIDEEAIRSAGHEGYIESETDKAFHENETVLVRKGRGKTNVYFNIPKVNLDEIVIDYKECYDKVFAENKKYMPAIRKDYATFRNESSKIVSYLVREFEMRKNAQQMSRAKVSKTGELNMSKIQDYKFSEDIFRKITKVPNGKSHGLVMFIDWSGSMYEYINSTIKQLLNLTLFCRKVNIPFEVYAFHSNSKKAFFSPRDIYQQPPNNVQVPKVGDINLKSFSLINLLSSRMSISEFNDASAYLSQFTGMDVANYYVVPHALRMSGTPLNECIISAFEVISEFKKTTKMEIINSVFLTDGEGSPLYERIESIDRGVPKMHRYYTNGMYNCIFRDPITKHQEDCSLHGSDPLDQKIALLKLLKKREGINVVGFHICNNRDMRSVMEQHNMNTAKIDSNLMKFSKEGFLFFEDMGFDEYYALKSNRLDLDEEELVVNSDTTRGLVKAFSKYTGGKINSRIILKRFIGIIA